MTRMLLVAAASLAALSVGAAPAHAELITGFYGTPAGGSGFARVGSVNDGRIDRRGFDNCFSNGERFHGTHFHDGHDGEGGGDGRHVRHDRGDRCQSDVVLSYYGGEWAEHNNRGWDSDSYNDWWHDRPDRAYPAWMRRNQDCQRPWFAGNTLTC